MGLWKKVLEINGFDEVTLNALSHWSLYLLDVILFIILPPPPLFVESRGRGDSGETSALSLTLPSLVCVALVRQLPTLAW